MDRRRDPQKQVVLRSESSPTDSRHLSAKLTDDGGLEIYGHDWGDSVEAFFGRREYEWSWTIKPEHVPLLVEALGGAPGEPVLEVLARECTRPGDTRLSQILSRDKSVPSRWWSWHSD